MPEVKEARELVSDALHGSVDNPEAYISRDRRRALATGVEIPDRAHGSALFADVSGFTQLTEALAEELGPQRGSEELTANLNRVFHALIADLEDFGGDVIYFSGDALTCWIDRDDGVRAATCALAMQETMAKVGEVRTPGGTRVQLAMKVAVVVGSARRFVVGDPEIQLIEVLAGRLVDELAAVEQVAESGEVILGQSALESLAGRVVVAEYRADTEDGRRVGRVTSVLEPADVSPRSEPEPRLPEEHVRPWLLPAVYERMRTGRGEFLAELRPAIPVFARFSGIDYDSDDEAIEKLDQFVRGAQRILAEYGGNLLQLTLGDKGAYLYAVFGSPLAHEDDAARAAAAALELLELDQVTAAREIQIGVAHGRLRSGTYGHAMRRTFVCLGDAVNLAARLMSKAPPGQVYVSEAVQRQAEGTHAWERLPDLTVKGKAAPVAVFRLTGAARVTGSRATRYELPIVGRQAELSALEAGLARARGGQGSVIGIAAEAGIGKSRLVAEFVRGARRRGLLVAFGECQAFGTRTSYFVWHEIWRRLLHVEVDRSDARRVHALEQELEAVDPALGPRAPLLDVVLDISIPGNELTRSFDAKLRKASLESLLADCLHARASEEPLVLVLEDCHWIDPLSRDLLVVLARTAASLPVLVVLAYRPEADPGGGLGLERLPHFSEVTLTELEPDEAELLIRSKLAHLHGAGTVAPPALVDLVTQRSQGNPFYVEELLNYIEDQDLDVQDGAALEQLQVPESLHSLILSRIDTLNESPRRTLKVASVVGRSFRAPALPGIYPELGSLADVRDHVGTLRHHDLVTLDQEAQEAYIFKHVVTQEVTYESLPFAMRAMLHERAGGYIEETEPDSVERNLDLLAHHYWHSGNVEKKREYLVRAGDAAKANYANAAAIDYFARAAPLLERADRWRVTRRMGEVLEITGDWLGAEGAYRKALALAEATGDGSAAAWTHTSLADLARKRGDYDQAHGLLEAAARSFQAADDDAGVGQVYHLAGTLAAQRGQYDKAVEYYDASLEIRERLDDRASMGGLLSNLGVVAEYRGDYASSRSYHERALALRREIGDRWAIGVSQTNLGMIAVLQHEYEEARMRFEDAMRLNREVGDEWMVAISHNNLGNATRGLGDYVAARRHYADSLRAYRDYDDKWAVAFLLEDIGVLAALLDQPEQAFELVGAADRLREEIGTPRAPGLLQSLETQLAPAHERIGAKAEAAARTRGRELESTDAIERAVAFCDLPGD